MKSFPSKDTQVRFLDNFLILAFLEESDWVAFTSQPYFSSNPQIDHLLNCLPYYRHQIIGIHPQYQTVAGNFGGVGFLGAEEHQSPDRG